jgi:hypothetical protein
MKSALPQSLKAHPLITDNLPATIQNMRVDNSLFVLVPAFLNRADFVASLKQCVAKECATLPALRNLLRLRTESIIK